MRRSVLFLDDDPIRIREITSRREALGCDLTVVETARACIETLSSRSFDLVMLDHDLGGEVFCDSDREDCGMEVVRWLRSHGGSHGAFIVHTMNTVAAAAMFLELQRMGYQVRQAPFGSGGFYDYLYETLGIVPDRRLRRRRRTVGERVREYFRSLRLGGR